MSTSFHRHHRTVTAFPSGSDTAPSTRIVSPARAERRLPPRMITTGSWLAAAYVGVIDHLTRAAKSCCAAGVKFGSGDGGRVVGPSGPTLSRLRMNASNDVAPV